MEHLSSWAKDGAPSSTEECECGSSKSKRAICCDRCAFLDNHYSSKRGATQSEMLHTLSRRGSPVATVGELSQELGIGKDAVSHLARRMIQRGRLVKFYSDEFSNDTNGVPETVYKLVW